MRRFAEKIRALRKAQNRIIFMRYLLLGIALTLVLLALHYGIYHLSAQRLLKFYAALGIKFGLILGLLYLVIVSFRSFLDDRSAARLLDIFNKDKADTYQNAWELQQEEKTELIEAVMQLADRKAENQEIKADKEPLRQVAALAGIIVAASLLLLIIDGSGYRESLHFFRQMKMPAEEHKDFIEVSPGNISLTRGSDLEVIVIEPEPNITHTLHWKQEKVWREEAMFNQSKLFRNLDYSFTYYLTTPYAVSDTFMVNVYELPSIREYLIKYKYPAYTGLKEELLTGSNGHLKALTGTETTLEIMANNPLDTAAVIFDNGVLLNMERRGRSNFSSQFPIERSGSYHINLLDFLGNRNERVVKSITAIEDAVPEVRIVFPGRDTLLDQNMLLRLELRATDDFGLKNLKLKFQVNNEVEDSLLIQGQIPGSVIEREYIFDLNSIWLLPGDRLTYWAEITDNSPAQQTGRSQKFIARFPSIAEIYEEIERSEEQKSDFMQKSLEESKQLQEDFEKKRRELMKKEEYNWEDKKDLEKILEKQENLSENLENMAESYQELVEKMQNNQALSSETLEKMQRIQELMEEISNDDLKLAMEEMAKAMENMDPEVLQKAMENLKFSMEDFAEKIDQTLKLLEQIKKEQTLQKALEIAEELEKMQQDLNERTENGENTDKLAADQATQQERLASLQKQMEAANNLMTPKEDAKVKEQMEELLESGLLDSLSSDISEASQQLSEQQMQQAQQNQQQASAKMQRLRKKLENMNSMMSMSGSAAIGEALDLAIRSLIFMSREQVDIRSRYGRDPFAILPNLIAEHEAISLTLQKLYSVPMIVLALGPKFVYDVNYTMSIFRELFQHINDAQSTSIEKYLLDIQKGINLMIYDLMQSSQNMQQGGGGGGMQSLMQQLQQMGEQQMMMNMMTQQLFQQMMEGGKPTQSMRQEMQRLAAEEERLAENLKRMLQNDTDAQKQTSAINQMIEDLEGISRNLKMGKLDQNLIDTQERILSRLLDAQKSIHKREFSKKRKAETSEFLEWDTPEEIKLKFDILRQKALLEENYQNFPPEYQELIREYLKRVNSE